MCRADNAAIDTQCEFAAGAEACRAILLHNITPPVLPSANLRVQASANQGSLRQRRYVSLVAVQVIVGASTGRERQRTCFRQTTAQVSNKAQQLLPER